MRRNYQKSEPDVMYAAFRRRRYAMRKRIGAVLCACLMAFSLFPLNCRGEESPALTEIIILLDSSGSMATENSYAQGESCARLAAAWAEELCILLEGKPVLLRLMTFHDHPEGTPWPDVFVENMSSVNQDDLRVHLSEIENIAFDGQYTNHLKALEHARDSTFGGSPRSIIMISDGQMRPDPNSVNTSGQDGNREKKFVNLCKTLNDAPDTTVYLLGLGNSLELFQTVKKETQVTVFENEVDFEALTAELLGRMGISVQTGTGPEVVENQFDFDLPDGLARAVIGAAYIGKSEKELVLTEEDWQTVIPWYNGRPLERRGFKLDRSFYLYLDEPPKGHYCVELPEGKWSCKVLNIEQCIVNALHVVLLEESRTLLPTADLPNSTYKISSWKETTLSITADTSGKGDPYSTDFYCLMWEAGDSPEDRSGELLRHKIFSDAEHRKNREWEQKLTGLEPGKTYYCCVRMRVGSETIESEIIQLSVLDDVISSQVNGDIETPIEESVYLPKELADIETLEYRLGEISLVKGEYNQEVGVDFGADGSLTFKEARTYVLSISNNGNTAARITFEIGGSNHTTHDILEWLHNNPMGVAIAVVPLLVFAFVVPMAMKRRAERAD